MSLATAWISLLCHIFILKIITRSKKKKEMLIIQLNLLTCSLNWALNSLIRLIKHILKINNLHQVCPRLAGSSQFLGQVTQTIRVSHNTCTVYARTTPFYIKLSVSVNTTNLGQPDLRHHHYYSFIKNGKVDLLGKQWRWVITGAASKQIHK